MGGLIADLLGYGAAVTGALSLLLLALAARAAYLFLRRRSGKDPEDQAS